MSKFKIKNAKIDWCNCNILYLFQKQNIQNVAAQSMSYIQLNVSRKLRFRYKKIENIHVKNDTP